MKGNTDLLKSIPNEEGGRISFDDFVDLVSYPVMLIHADDYFLKLKSVSGKVLVVSVSCRELSYSLEKKKKEQN